MRKEFKPVVWFALAGALSATPACTPEPTPIETTTPNYAEIWANLPAAQKIVDLQALSLPPIDGFNAHIEMVKSVAQYYCETVTCNRTPEQMAENVFFLSGED